MNNNLIIFIFILFGLSGCGGERCIDADYFGHANFTISSRYTQKELGTGQIAENQAAPWRDSTYRVNGRPLVVMVRNWDFPLDHNTSADLSAWCPWFSNSTNKNTLSTFCQRLSDCNFYQNTSCPTARMADEKRILNAPCIF